MKTTLFASIKETVNATIERRIDNIARQNPRCIGGYDETRERVSYAKDATVVDQAKNLIKSGDKYFIVSNSEYRYDLLAAKVRGDYLNTLTIPEGFSKVSDGAFAGCLEIETVYIPHWVTEIGDNAFAGCPNLKNVIIGDRSKAEYHWLRIGKDAFANTAVDMLYISVSDGNKITIGTGAFRNCKKLWSVHLSAPTVDGTKDGAITVRPRAFYGCNKLSLITLENICLHMGSFAGIPAMGLCKFSATGTFFCETPDENADLFWYSQDNERTSKDAAKFAGVKIVEEESYEEHTQ